jgi:geranylgeranyl pyrophosphate synthase
MATGPAGLPCLRDQVGRVLDDFLGQQRPVLAAISGELLPWLAAIEELLVGGKRLRPAFCYWGWRAAGGADCPEIITAASALELLHASALVHDDVMDASETRRGRPAVHRRFAARHAVGGWRGSADAFGIGAAILIGDLLQAWTDELLHVSGLPAAALLHSRPVLDAMRTEVIAGQYLDLLSQAAGDGTVDSALRVVRYKSAKYTIERPLHLGVALASAVSVTTPPGGQAADGRAPSVRAPSVRAPGVRAPGVRAPGVRGPDDRMPGGREPGGREPGGRGPGGRGPGDRSADGPAAVPVGDEQAIAVACTGYGIPLGIAFQLRDDVLGVLGDPAETGKPVSDDVREGKRTVLMALARQRANADQAEVLDRNLGNPLVDAGGAAAVRAVITDTGALAECEAMIDRNVAEALSALDGAPVADVAKEALADLAFAATARSD